MHTTQKTQQASTHTLLLVRIRKKKLTMVELGELGSQEGAWNLAHLLFRLEAYLSSHPGSLLACSSFLKGGKSQEKIHQVEDKGSRGILKSACPSPV